MKNNAYLFGKIPLTKNFKDKLKYGLVGSYSY